MYIHSFKKLNFFKIKQILFLDLKTSNRKTFVIQETVHIAEIYLVDKENSLFKSFLQKLEVRSGMVLVLVSSLDLTGQRLGDFFSLEQSQAGTDCFTSNKLRFWLTEERGEQPQLQTN